MSNYTTQTAALKATSIDTRLLNAKHIETKKLFINGELLKKSPNEAMFQMMIAPSEEENGFYLLQSMKLDWDGETKQVEIRANLLKGSESEGQLENLENGIYVVIQIDENFVECLCENFDDESYESFMYTLPTAKFMLVNLGSNIIIEQCILDSFVKVGGQGVYWAIKICEEDENLSELYGGVSEDLPYFVFLVSIPYYIPENDTSSSTYSLRKTNPFDNLREKFEQMRQQNLDNPTE